MSGDVILNLRWKESLSYFLTIPSDIEDNRTMVFFLRLLPLLLCFGLVSLTVPASAACFSLSFCFV